MSIGENYERNVTPIRSNISRFSRGTTDQAPQVESQQAWIPDHPSSGGLKAELQEFLRKLAGRRRLSY
jgi:hypothetical protein